MEPQPPVSLPEQAQSEDFAPRESNQKDRPRAEAPLLEAGRVVKVEKSHDQSMSTCVAQPIKTEKQDSASVSGCHSANSDVFRSCQQPQTGTLVYEENTNTIRTLDYDDDLGHESDASTVVYDPEDSLASTLTTNSMPEPSTAHRNQLAQSYMQDYPNLKDCSVIVERGNYDYNIL